MTNKFYSFVDGNHSRVASEITPRFSRPDCVSFASRWRVLPILLLCLTLFIGSESQYYLSPIAYPTSHYIYFVYIP